MTHLTTAKERVTLRGVVQQGLGGLEHLGGTGAPYAFEQKPLPAPRNTDPGTSLEGGATTAATGGAAVRRRRV